jgi:NAD-dependent dihydropyrimidine dehydrogenase PreA subunit
MKTRILIEYQSDTVRKPILSEAIKTHAVELNILKANINAQMNGRIFAEIDGSSLEITRFMDFMTTHKVFTDIRQSLLDIDFAKCQLCHNCTTICPTNALSVNASFTALSYDPYKCVSCDRCISACPNGAISEL